MAHLYSTFLIWFIYLAALINQGESNGSTSDNKSSTEVQRTIPERLDLNRHKRDLSTKNEGGHDDDASFLVKAFEKEIVLRVKRNKNLLSPYFTVRYFNVDDSEVFRWEQRENCYYHGTLQDQADSMVVLNTCNGLSGLINDGKDVYYIEPETSYKRDGLHKIYPAKDDHQDFTSNKCGVSDEATKYRKEEQNSHSAGHGFGNLHRLRRDIDDFYRKYFTTDETRYNELVLVVDHQMWNSRDILGPYRLLAHEMGHNFAIGHDGKTCKCLTPRGYIMGGHETRIPGFSNCSMESLKGISDNCLYNLPKKVINSACGKGIREEGEQCDCGTIEMCKEDPCCEPGKCVLKTHAQCSDLHNDCCKNCVFKKHGTLCRSALNDCDTPEYCTGDSGDCPEQQFVRDGFPCNRTATLIPGNTDWWRVVTRSLKQKIQARYVRINPRYWHYKNCMRTELYGCPVSEENPSQPTPLNVYNRYYLQPKVANCNPPDNTPIIYKSQLGGSVCNEDFKQFRMDANGILFHHCSGKRVCNQNGGTHNGAKIILSSKCPDEDSK